MLMKKLVAIICVLLVIFIGMYINKTKSKNSNCFRSRKSRRIHIKNIYVERSHRRSITRI